MIFDPIPNVPGAVGAVINLAGGRVGVIIDRGLASLVMDDQVTMTRTFCAITPALLREVSALLTEAAAILS